MENLFKLALNTHKKLTCVTTLTREETQIMITLKQTELTLNHKNLRFDIVWESRKLCRNAIYFVQVTSSITPSETRRPYKRSSKQFQILLAQEHRTTYSTHSSHYFAANMTDLIV